MTQKYYGTKLIAAWKSKGGKDNSEDGYAVKYEDGYISWSPKDVFEKSYQSMYALSFGHAIEALKAGNRVCRSGWNGKGMSLELQCPDENSKMSLPYIYMKTPNVTPHSYELVPWLASQTDMLANDWMVLEEVAPAPVDVDQGPLG